MGGDRLAVGRATAARSVLHSHIILNASEGELALTEVSKVLRPISAPLGLVGGFLLNLETKRANVSRCVRETCCSGTVDRQHGRVYHELVVEKSF